MSDIIKYVIILLGNSGVGKETLIDKLSNNEDKEKIITAIGIDKITLDLNLEIDKNGTKENQKVEVSLLNTIGQEKFRSITFSYFKGSDGFFMIYDITNKNSFENIEMWLESIKECIDPNSETKYVKFLIGNKSDLMKGEQNERKVTEEEAKKACEKNEMIWVGEQNLEEMDKNQLTELISGYTKEIYKRIGVKTIKKQDVKKIREYKKKPTNCICF